MARLKIKTASKKSRTNTVKVYWFYYWSVEQDSHVDIWYVEGDIKVLKNHIVLFAMHGYAVTDITRHYIPESYVSHWALGGSIATKKEALGYNFPWES